MSVILELNLRSRYQLCKPSPSAVYFYGLFPYCQTFLCCETFTMHVYRVVCYMEARRCHSLSLSLSILTAIFPGEPGLASFAEAKDDGSNNWTTGSDNWSYKTRKAPVKSSPSTNQHPTFYRPDSGCPSFHPLKRE